MKKKSVSLDDIVNEVVEDLARQYHTTYSEVVNVMLYEALAEHLETVEETLRTEFIMKKHKRRITNKMKKEGLSNVLWTTAHRLLSKRWSDERIFGILKEHKAEFEELGLLEDYYETLENILESVKRNFAFRTRLIELLEREVGE